MTAETGDIAKVSGSRIAIPFAPPSPGSTPISTPRMMPTIISIKFSGCRATAKPCIKRPSSSMSDRSGWGRQ